MLGCSTICPRCQHQFACCPPVSCCNARRSLHGLSGGGLVTTLTPANPWPSPQVSPSAQLQFVIPPFAPLLPTPPPMIEAKPETELERLQDIVRALRLSGWYYEGITYQQSEELLKDKPVGTFLVRDSSAPGFLYSLSVQTERGPTSVRLHYISGYFRLDAQTHIQPAMPSFPSVVELIEHYVQQSRSCKSGSHVWVDPKGKWYSAITLNKPLLKEDTAPSLKHLARLAVHKAIKSTGRPKLNFLPPPHTQLELPKSVSQYLSEYQYSI